MNAIVLNYGTFGGSDVTFLLSNGDSTTLGSTGSGYMVPDFFGAIDSASFISVLITSSDSTLNVGSAVPEPSSLILGSCAVVGTAAFARRRRQRVSSSV